MRTTRGANRSLKDLARRTGAISAMCGFFCLALMQRSHAQITSVLFIGNSYTSENDMPQIFRDLAFSLGDTVNVGMQAPGGYTMSLHTINAPTMSAIASQPWDFVVLQEHGQSGALIAEDAVSTWSEWSLCNAIEANYECTYPVFFMTWGWEYGDPYNCLFFPSMCTYEGMQQNLRESYLELAVNNDGYAAPVGVAWQRVRQDHPEIDLYQADGHHPTMEGSYLAACVFYSTLFNASCVGASFTSGLPPATATILQGIASSTVLDSLDTWNMNVANGTEATFTTNEGMNTITCYHSGQGIHEWTCSNSETFTGNGPTFTFDTSGTYTITHSYSDPCGNSDTATWSGGITVVGIAEEGAAPTPYALWSPGPLLVEVAGGTGSEDLWIGDLQGRTVITRPLGSDHMRIACPAGLHIWRIRDRFGTPWTGRVMVQ
ncbi:MAG: DUF4886 domain-containing protein [Flavobacteriales bacterium]